jgi:hypothetical protein
VFCQLDHDSLFCALQACKAWRSVGSAEALWEQQCKLRGWGQPAAATAAAGTSQQQQQQGPFTCWREWYRLQYQNACYECLQPTQRRTLLVGSLRLRLCQACSAAYIAPGIGSFRRLLPASEAKRKCCLRDAGWLKTASLCGHHSLFWVAASPLQPPRLPAFAAWLPGDIPFTFSPLDITSLCRFGATAVCC